MKRLSGVLVAAAILGASYLPAKADCPYTPPTNWYFSVQNASPGTQVWDSMAAQYVVLADAGYVAWLALGCTATPIDTDVNLWGYLSSYNAGNWVFVSSASLGAIGTTSTQNTSWQKSYTLSASAGGLTITVVPVYGASATTVRWPGAVPIGGTVEFINNGATFPYTLIFSGNTVMLPPGQAVSFTLLSNVTANGTWATSYSGVNVSTTTGAQTIIIPGAGNAFVATSLDPGATAGPNIVLDRSSASPAANDVIPSILFQGRNSVAAAIQYAAINTIINNATSTTEAGSLTVRTYTAGTAADELVIGNGLLAGAATGGLKGTGTLNATTLYQAGTALTALATTTPAAGVAAWLATPSSANLATAVTDETGSGALVFATSPTLVTPILGTPTSGTLTNTTGFPASALAGTTIAASVVTSSLTSVGTLTGGATGAGFTIALTTSTVTGTLPAARLPAFGSGDVSFASGGGAGTIAANAVTLAKLATQATNTVLGNATAGTAVPTALAVGTCSTAASALIWTTNTGFGCNTAITASAIAVGGITGLGTGVATALAVNVGSAGAFVTFNGALGTPSAGTLTNATGLPISTGVSGLGTNVATFLATPTSANLAAAVTNESGSGALVFGTNPDISITTAGSLIVADSVFSIKDDGDLTKIAVFQASTIATGTTRTFTFPNASGTFALTANDLSVFAATTSAQLAGVISNETGTGQLVFATSPILITPDLGTPSAAILTNATGYQVANINGLGSGVATFLATPSSANLAAAVTGETGTGALVFATSPTLVTPVLGVATATTVNGASFAAPQTTVAVTGTNVTYTTPAGATRLVIEMIGGGGGGAGSGTTPGAAGDGGDTCLAASSPGCTSSLLKATGGQKGLTTGGPCTVGTGTTGTLTEDDTQDGALGGVATGSLSQRGGDGGSSRYAGYGSGGNIAAAGIAAAANSGSGGGGAGDNTTGNTGGGGCAGGWLRHTIAAPAASYVYTVGAAGTAGTAGTSGFAGAAGGSGKIRIEAYFNFLLKRDLQGDNDNTPMFINEVA